MATIQQRRAWAAKAAKAYRAETGTEQGDVVCDLICDLLHLAEGYRQDALEQARRGIYHWYAEKHNEAHSCVTIDVQSSGGSR